ncbi:hypothetical protein P175DRAFT_0256729 [Aspergillus ochraceoroseus IBT 24754]|uniref:Uncharacterized protein n=1 Tax=Aspergillus ochraceoroseus IBT 24754 TaxID=1392256 RepID=A0A2T5LU66_9EURO|nr:uncharacterized protein P175DRAFT_0256729 [Aspergillus ochraceoroseus IBT 24754]PTU19824.1 hypothetical protein P175DRAFT_0256729 [Aspergillus ochraceoroseus IBT 24754]
MMTMCYLQKSIRKLSLVTPLLLDCSSADPFIFSCWSGILDSSVAPCINSEPTVALGPHNVSRYLGVV